MHPLLSYTHVAHFYKPSHGTPNQHTEQTLLYLAVCASICQLAVTMRLGNHANHRLKLWL